MTARPLTTLTATAMAVIAVTGTAGAATLPSVSKIEPLSLGIGDTLTLTGKNFVPGRGKDTVVFRRVGQRAVFVKADTATRTRITVVIPLRLKDMLGKTPSGELLPTRFQVRVLAKRFAKSYSKLAASPTIVPRATGGLLPSGPASTPAPTTASAVTVPAGPAPVDGAPAAPAATVADCDSDRIPDALDPDDDNDALTDSLEGAIGTDRCKADTDGDGASDAFEYQSALDLNQRSCPASEYPVPCSAAYPYPYKRPYPNPLDGSDANLDFDGDSLTTIEEFRASTKHGPLNLSNLWYSAGKKASQDSSATDGCRGVTAPPPFDGIGTRPEFERAGGTYPDVTTAQYAAYSLDNMVKDGCLTDGERDEDGDFLNNYEEAHGSLSGSGLWKSLYSEPLYTILYTGTDWLDPDTDGDTVLDGLDDQDHDDFLNVEEQQSMRGTESRTKDDADTGVRTGLWIDAFNPCLPAPRSATCPDYRTFEGDVPRPFYKIGDQPPKPRWPLYAPRASETYSGSVAGPEVWSGLPGAQTLPPPHPLPR